MSQAVDHPAAPSLACPACGDWEARRVASGVNGLYERLECGGCGLLYSAPMQAASGAWYESSYLYDDATQRRDVAGKAAESARWEFRNALDVMRGRAHSVLDVGCGGGEFLMHAQRQGMAVAGLDFNRASVDFARKLLGVESIYAASIEEFMHAHPQERFEAVSAFEVLEHVADPAAVVRSAAGLLRPGGVACFSVPGYRRWPALFDPDVDTPPHHLTMWTEAALRALLAGAGLSEVQILRKPLDAGDIGVHAKWALRRLLLRRGANGPGPAQPALTGSASRTWGLAVLRVGVAPLRLLRRSGGFTLLAVGVRPQGSP